MALDQQSTPQHLLHLSPLVQGARGIGVTPFFSVVDACRREENYETCSRPNLFVLPEWELGLLGCRYGEPHHFTGHCCVTADLDVPSSSCTQPTRMLLLDSCVTHSPTGGYNYCDPWGKGLLFSPRQWNWKIPSLSAGSRRRSVQARCTLAASRGLRLLDPRVETYWQEVPRCPNLPVHHGMSLDSLFWQGQAAQPVLARFLAYDNQRSPFVDFVEHTEASPTMKCALLVWLRPKPYWYLNPKQL